MLVTAREIASKFPRKSARLSRIRSSRRRELRKRLQPNLMDEPLFHPGRVLRMKVWNGGLGLASSVCTMAAPWCREQQLLTHRHIFRHKAEHSMLSLANRGIKLTSRATVLRLRLEPKRSKRRWTR
jgi:hypothetical protein